jgi:hypothetical protein
MKREDKRGLSTVVATLLIILLVIVAVAIVWGVIRTIIVNNSNQITLGKFTIDLKIVSIRQTPQDVNIKVKRNAGEGELEGIVFSIFDGERTHIYEKHNVSLEPLEMKTFVVDYQGNIVSVSIYPILLTDAGKTLTGGVSDTYYPSSTGGGYISGNCTTNCTDKSCGDNGCGGSCGGCSGSTPYCVQGTCSSNNQGLIGNCSCAANICTGTTCDDGLGGSCPGELTIEQDCGAQMCGESPNGCGSCGSCGDSGHYCNEGTCSPICLPSDCGSRICGGIPGRSECGETFCGLCNAAAGETCNETSGTCFVCQPDCLGKQCGDDKCGGSCGDCKISPFNSSYNCNATQSCQMCTPDCVALGKECGPVPNGCGESCGNCTELYGYPENSCTAEGMCFPPEESLNNGTVVSVWPLPIGRNLFVSNGLPLYGEDEKIANLSNAHFVKIVSAYKRCYQILEIDYPVNPGQYTVVKVSMASTDIEVGDYYEIWETLEGCNR